MATDAATIREYGLGKTQRRDSWWAQPLAIAASLVTFILYATFRGLYNDFYQYGHGTPIRPDGMTINPESAYFLSPFYSPLLALPSWMPGWIGPAIFVMWMPAGFRLTCYYARKAYYRALFADPPACAVAEICKNNYQGERGLWRFQNLHRFFLYLALLLVVMHCYHVYEALRWPAAEGTVRLGLSVGTLVLTVDLVFLSLYVFSCHSLRHLVGGRLDCFSSSPARQTQYKLWKCTSALNEHHGAYFWLSLFSVGFADFYIWMVSSGTWSDFRLF